MNGQSLAFMAGDPESSSCGHQVRHSPRMHMYKNPHRAFFIAFGRDSEEKMLVKALGEL